MSSPAGTRRKSRKSAIKVATASHDAQKPGGKRARTREKLLDAATELFKRKGIHATSLDEVAAHAGLTKGAIYGNFENKDELVFAVAGRAAAPWPLFESGAPLNEQIRNLTHTLRTSEDARYITFLIELDLYTLTHKALKKRLTAIARQRYATSAENLSKIVTRRVLPLPPLEFAVVVHALFNGLLYQKAFVPEIVTEELVRKALEALID